MTPDQLALIVVPSDPYFKKFPFCPSDELEGYAASLTAAMAEASIESPLAQATFVAQIAWESELLNKLEEDCDWTAIELNENWPHLFPSVDAAVPFAHQPQKAANRAYANRGGNGTEASGDGWLYRGRTQIGMTFKDSYRQYGDQFGVDLVSNPDAAAVFDLGARISCAIWNNKGLTTLANAGNFDAVTLRINGACTPGSPSYNDARKILFAAARAAFQA